MNTFILFLKVPDNYIVLIFSVQKTLYPFLTVNDSLASLNAFMQDSNILYKSMSPRDDFIEIPSTKIKQLKIWEMFYIKIFIQGKFSITKIICIIANCL